jgi:hypothetical protein
VASQTKRCYSKDFHVDEAESDLNKFDKIIDELEWEVYVYLLIKNTSTNSQEIGL